MLLQHNWSSLPDEIIAEIISHLDVPRPRSSAINISATTFKVNYLGPVTFNISDFWKILDNLFTIFTTPSTNTFSIYLDDTLYERPCVRLILDSWAHRLRVRNTQHIEIRSDYVSFGDRVCLPSVFQIQSLVSLHLSCVPLVSNPIVLPNPKKLSLGSVNHGFLGRLLIGCPSLEDLSFSLTEKPKGRNGLVSISSKNLKRLCIILDIYLVLGNIEVIIDTPALDHLFFSANSPRLSMRMTESVSNLKSLELSGVSTTMLYSNPTKTIFEFPNMTHLTLSLGSSEIFKAIFVQQRLPPYYPNLEVIVLNFSIFYDIVWDTKDTFVLVDHVKHLELHMGIVRIDGQTLNLVTWLLRSAPILKKLVFSGYGTRPSDDFLGKFHKTVLKCAEDTSGCEIDFLGGYKL
ncbi:putative F-box/FBD/LRR-repeat protein At5g25850 [Silene latifolia]|uniref:putative F-box/FBD/LRR-repeat protein At5g25850 n=1 Tax=Silene latifolia TaxID=37657 RepID=UPI003D777125